MIHCTKILVTFLLVSFFLSYSMDEKPFINQVSSPVLVKIFGHALDENHAEKEIFALAGTCQKWRKLIYGKQGHMIIRPVIEAFITPTLTNCGIEKKTFFPFFKELLGRLNIIDLTESQEILDTIASDTLMTIIDLCTDPKKVKKRSFKFSNLLASQKKKRDLGFFSIQSPNASINYIFMGKFTPLLFTDLPTKHSELNKAGIVIGKIPDSQKFLYFFLSNGLSPYTTEECKCLFPSGDYYEGNLYKYRRQDYGKYIYNNGTVYEGNFYKNSRTDQGKLLYKNGTIYEGRYMNDNRDGAGKLTLSSGLTLKLTYQKGLPYRDVDILAPDGYQFFTQFIDKTLWNNGVIKSLSGQYEDGKLEDFVNNHSNPQFKFDIKEISRMISHDPID